MSSNTQDSSLHESMIKLLIIGGPQVGKSSLVSKFCNNTYNPSYVPTSGVHFKYKMLDFTSKKLKVQVWDTAGADHSDPLLKIYYKKAMGILLAFSLNNKQSLEDLEKWMQHLQSNVNPNAFIVLVGNKSDLAERAVEEIEIKNFQDKYKVDKYVETSVKEGSSVNEVFTELVKEVKDRIEKGSFKADENSSLALGNIEKKPIVSSLTRLETEPAEKEVIEEKDLSAELKAREEEMDKKAEEAFEAFKKQMALELKESRKTTRDEIDRKLHEVTESLRKELNEKIASRDRLEEDIKRKAEESMNTLRDEVSFFRRVFDNFSQSHVEETFQLTLKTEQTLAGLVKENALLEERLAKMEKQLKENHRNVLSNSDKEDIHSSAYKRKQRRTDTEIVDITANLARSRSDKVEVEGSSVQQKIREASFDKTSRDLNESTRNCSNSTEIFYAGGGKKATESGERRVILDSISNPNAFLETERTWEKDIDSACPRFYNSGDEELYKTVEELQYNMMTLTQEMKRTQNKINSCDIGKRNKRHIRSICKKSNKENRLTQYGAVLDSNDIGNEISRLWDTINSLVKNTHEEIDKVKEEIQRSRKSRITDRRDALVEKNANGSMRELRDDIHNQLIEIQRELEGKYGTLRNNLTLNYESFLKYFHTEQNKLRECMEDRCLEMIEEAIKGKDKIEDLLSKRNNSENQSPISIKNEAKNHKAQTLEKVEEMKKKKSLALKVISIEAQQKQMFSSYTNSFKSIWEAVQMLSDKMNELNDKGSYIAEISRTGGMSNNYVDWRKAEF